MDTVDNLIGVIYGFLAILIAIGFATESVKWIRLKIQNSVFPFRKILIQFIGSFIILQLFFGSAFDKLTHSYFGDVMQVFIFLFSISLGFITHIEFKNLSRYRKLLFSTWVIFIVIFFLTLVPVIQFLAIKLGFKPDSYVINIADVIFPCCSRKLSTDFIFFRFFPEIMPGCLKLITVSFLMSVSYAFSKKGAFGLLKNKSKKTHTTHSSTAQQAATPISRIKEKVISSLIVWAFTTTITYFFLQDLIASGTFSLIGNLTVNLINIKST